MCWSSASISFLILFPCPLPLSKRQSQPNASSLPDLAVYINCVSMGCRGREVNIAKASPANMDISIGGSPPAFAPVS